MNLKKIGLILLFIAVTGSVGFFLYRLFFAPAVTPPEEIPPEEPGVPVTGLPPAAPGVPPGETPPGEDEFPPGLEPSAASPVAAGGPTQTELLEANVAAPTMNASGAIGYYDRDDGLFYRRLADGSLRQLSNQTFPQVEEITWSPGGEKAVLAFPDESKVVFDFETQEQVTLPSHWEDFDFSQDGESFVAKSMSFNPDNRWLIVANSDGSNPRLVEHLGENADKVTVAASPDASVVALSETGEAAGFDTREVLLIGQNDENFKALRVDGFGMIPKWSPSGTHLLYSASASGDGYRPMLWFVAAKGDSIGQDRTKIGLNTWADKCTFADETTVYCAVPDDLPEGVGLQRDLADSNPDSIWKVDLRSGSTTMIGRPEDDTTIDTLMVSQDGGTLFFRDKLAGGLESMRLR